MTQNVAFWILHIDGLVLGVYVGLQVIAHTHYLPRVDGSMGKRVVPMSLHRYNWDLPRPSNTSQPYFACEGFGANCTQLRVLAFSPSVEVLLGSSASWHEFAFLLQGLAALATTLGRAVAWPSLPCNTSWIARSAFKLPPCDLDHGRWSKRQAVYTKQLSLCLQRLCSLIRKHLLTDFRQTTSASAAGQQLVLSCIDVMLCSSTAHALLLMLYTCTLLAATCKIDLHHA